MENYKLSLSTEWFDLVVRGVLVPTLGCLGMIFNVMIIIVLRRPEFTKVSINLIMLCKFTQTIQIIQDKNIFGNCVIRQICGFFQHF